LLAEKRFSALGMSASKPKVHLDALSTLSHFTTVTGRIMHWIDRQRLRTELCTGTFLNLGSAASVEVAAAVGFDWLLIDLEHGNGSLADLRNMLLACRGSNSAPIVRLRSVETDDVKFVMDSGAAGIMFPFVNTAEEARRAVECMKYPPLGKRGVAGIIRATNYGLAWPKYFSEANSNSLVVVQIETPEAVANAAEIAAVPGVDVLFVGPLDLSVNLGCPNDFTTEPFLTALKQVVAVCEAAGKPAGILSRPQLVQQHKELGFRFLALGSDTGSIATGLQQSLNAMRGSP
jgi:2-keto-3-deoxy-L-rhamnonate aldolase RhmA